MDRIRKTSVGNTRSDVHPVAPPPSPTDSTMPGDTHKRAVSRCHECHGPLAQYHKGYPHGVNICELEHYDLCAGGIQEGKNRGGHFWKGCPEGFVPHPDCDKELVLETTSGVVEENLSPKSLSESESSTDTIYDPGENFVNPEEDGLQTRSRQSDTEKKEESEDIFVKSRKVASVKISSLEEEDLLLEAEMAEIARLEREAKVLKIKMKKQQAQEDLDRLQRQARGEGGRPKIDLSSMHVAVDNIRSRNHENQNMRDTSKYTGPTMDDIRRDAKTRQVVDNYMEDVQMTPSLSNARPAPTNQPSQFGKPKLKQNTQKQPQGGGHGAAGPVQRSSEPLFKWVTSVDRYGEEFRTFVEATPPPKQATTSPEEGRSAQ